jgi:hypothetical protein
MGRRHHRPRAKRETSVNPFSTLQSAISTRLGENAVLTAIPIITETLGDISHRIDRALSAGGVKAGTGGKVGLAILILTPKSRAVDDQRSEHQIVSVRVSVFCRPTINAGASGHQLAPLEILHEIMVQMLSWYRGPGEAGVKLIGFDSLESDQELTYFADFEIYKTLEVTLEMS